jgi:hypothetical protein
VQVRLSSAVHRAVIILCAALAVPNVAMTSHQAPPVIPPLDPGITWVLPSEDRLLSASPPEFAAIVRELQTRIGRNDQLSRAKVGLSAFLGLTMARWDIDTGDAAALREALIPVTATVDAGLDRVRPHGLPMGLSVITAIRERVDPVQTAAQVEDRRNVQWYHDQEVATGWVTYSRYARKLRRVQEAYFRMFGTLMAERMAREPQLLVALTGDGETEMSYDRFRDGQDLRDPVKGPRVSWADYSPFAVAEFRDWLRGEGLYAPGQSFAADAHPDAARYRGDRSPADDTNRDGHTLNGDYGTAFTTWALRYADWSLSDAESAGAVSASLKGPGETQPAGFDPPRVRAEGRPWFEVWIRFRQLLILHYNRDVARWVTEGFGGGGGIPRDRWYSAQIPTDMLFGQPPADGGVRLLTSGSAHTTADIRPYGTPGVTGYTVNLGRDGADGPYARTVVHVAPRMTAMGGRWAIVEWNPSDPWSRGRGVYDEEIAWLLQYRPTLLMPYKLNDGHYRVYDSGFEPALKDFVARIGQPGGWIPRVVWTPTAYLQAGTPLGEAQLTATASVPGRLSWNLSKGTMLPVGHHQLQLQFSPADRDFGSVTREVRLTVSPPGIPALTVDRETLDFTGVNDGGVVTSVSGPQTVRIAFEGTGQAAWTASADQPFVSVAPAAGQGAGVLTVTLAAHGARVGEVYSASAVVTVAAQGVAAGSSPRTISVNVRLRKQEP